MWWNGCTAFSSRLGLGNWFAVGGPLVMLLILAVLVIGAVFFFRRFNSPGIAGPAASLEVLRLRYARGEISREQFEQMAETLRR